MARPAPARRPGAAPPVRQSCFRGQWRWRWAQVALLAATVVLVFAWRFSELRSHMGGLREQSGPESTFDIAASTTTTTTTTISTRVVDLEVVRVHDASHDQQPQKVVEVGDIDADETLGDEVEEGNSVESDSQAPDTRLDSDSGSGSNSDSDSDSSSNSDSTAVLSPSPDASVPSGQDEAAEGAAVDAHPSKPTPEATAEDATTLEQVRAQVAVEPHVQAEPEREGKIPQWGEASPYPLRHPAPVSDAGPHLTHVFSTFNAKLGSSAADEMRIVQQSWKLAAARAAEHGIKVQFLDAVLPEDAPSVPEFAENSTLSWRIKDVFKGIVPTVGEVYERAYQDAAAEHVIVTNADIGATPDFYLKVWDLVSEDYYSPKSQLRAMHNTCAYLKACTAAKSRLDPRRHVALCRLDALTYFESQGGVTALFEDSMRQVAKLFVKSMAKSSRRAVTWEQAMQWYQLVVGSSVRAKFGDEDVCPKSAWQGAATVERLAALPLDTSHLDPEFAVAFTITRLDVPVATNVLSPAALAGQDNGAGMRKFMGIARAKGIRHPGNDCFVMRRKQIPFALRRMGHPQGVRPFGQWIPNGFRVR